MSEHELWTIVVPTDFSPGARRASTWATLLARLYGAELHLLHVHVVHEHNPVYRILSALTEGDEDAPSVRAHVEARLEEAKALYADAGVRVYTAYREAEDLADGVLAYARAARANVIAPGRRVHRALPSFTSGSLSVRLAGEAEASIMMVPDHGDEAAPLLRHVMVPVDFSPGARQALERARDLVRRSRARLSLVYVAETRVIPVFHDTGLFAIERLEADPEITARAHEALVEFYGGEDPDVRFVVLDGDVEAELLDFSEKNEVDLILLPTRGLGRTGRFGVGSTTEKLIRKALRPVMAIPVPDVEE